MSLRTSIDDGSWSDWTERASADHVRLDGPDGERNVRVQARDGRGTLGPVVSDAITIDSKAPVVRGPRIGLRSGTVGLGAQAIPVRLAWSVADQTSGVAAGQLRADCAGVSLMPPGVADLGPTPRRTVKGSVDDGLDTGTRCVLSASVTDLAGNKTTTGDISVRVRAIQDKPSSALTYSRGWRAVRSASAFGGTVRASTAANQWVRLRFTGSEIALVSNTASNRGRVRITIDGRAVATVDLRAPTSASRQIVFRQRLKPGAHSILVRVLDSRSTSTAARVDIDSFLLVGP